MTQTKHEHVNMATEEDDGTIVKRDWDLHCVLICIRFVGLCLFIHLVATMYNTPPMDGQGERFLVAVKGHHPMHTNHHRASPERSYA